MNNQYIELQNIQAYKGMISGKIKLQKYLWLFLWKVCKITGTGTYFALIAKLTSLLRF